MSHNTPIPMGRLVDGRVRLPVDRPDRVDLGSLPMPHTGPVSRFQSVSASASNPRSKPGSFTITPHLRVGGTPVVSNVGTEDEPIYVVAPNGDSSGAIPLVAMAAAKAITKKKDPDKVEARKARREARRASGKTVWQSIREFFGGGSVEDKSSGVEVVGHDELGAILIDTDGRRVTT